MAYLRQIFPRPYGYRSLVEGVRAKAISFETGSGVVTFPRPQGVYLRSDVSTLTVRFLGTLSHSLVASDVRTVTVYYHDRAPRTTSIIGFFDGGYDRA